MANTCRGAGTGQRRFGFDERRGAAGDAGGEVDERRPVVVHAHQVGTEPAAGRVVDVGDRVVEDERGAAVVVGELHVVVLPVRDGGEGRRAATSRLPAVGAVP